MSDQPNKTKYTVSFQIDVELSIDKSKFDQEFMDEFKKSFYSLENINDHVEHLAAMYLRGIVDNRNFIEGYGEPEEMGIEFHNYDFIDTDVSEN